MHSHSPQRPPRLLSLLPMPATEFAMAFTSTPRGARLARLFVAHCLDSWGHPHTSAVNETLTLITAELCANAVQHGRVPGRDFHVRLTAEADDRRLRVEVSDARAERRPAATVSPDLDAEPSPAAASSSSPRSPTTGASRTARAAPARPCGPPSTCPVPPSRTRASHSGRAPTVQQQHDAAPITPRDAKVTPQGEDVARPLCRVRRSITRRRQPGHAPRPAGRRRVWGERAMTDTPTHAADIDADTDADGVDETVDRKVVEEEQAQIKDFVKGLSADDIKSGNWFTKLAAHAMNAYTEKVDWQYFQDRYAGVPADVIVDQRIKMAARYAALEGGLSAGAYTATVAATIGSLGGASPATVPAAVATMMVDVAFISQLQLRLAYDVSVLYRVPIDVHDPEDLWKLIRVAFTIKSGEAANKTVVKAVPMVVRPLVKKFYSGTVLNAGKALPVVGRHLLQRNVIKIGIPLIGVPLAVLLNRYTTLVAGRHARAVFRNEARIIELAEGLSERSRHPELMLWVAWLVLRANAKAKIADDEALLMRHLVRAVRERQGVADERLAQVVDIDPADVWKRVADETGDLSDVLDAAERVAAVDGDLDSREKAILAELRERCRRG